MIIDKIVGKTQEVAIYKSIESTLHIKRKKRKKEKYFIHLPLESICDCIAESFLTLLTTNGRRINNIHKTRTK